MKPNWKNPTALQPGAQGMLDARRYTVRGRAVLEVEQDGDTYCWNEFYLVDGTGREATLVYEIAGDDSPWKLFTPIEPDPPPLSADDAAAKRVGDTLTLAGHSLRVTLVNQSRVTYVEGQTQEGVAVGKVANYFNAESRDQQFVVSWTGNEVEFYRGQSVSALRVEGAFNLPRSRPASNWETWTGILGVSNSGLVMVGGAMVVAIIVLVFLSWDPDEETSAPPARQAAKHTRLPEGAHGFFTGRNFRCIGHALVEVDTVAGAYDRHEYDLLDAIGTHVLLINGLGGGADEWHWFVPSTTWPVATPYEAANLRAGSVLGALSSQMKVVQLFRSRTAGTDGELGPVDWTAGWQQGVIARQEDDWVMLRWTESGLTFYRGKALDEKTVMTALRDGG